MKFIETGSLWARLVKAKLATEKFRSPILCMLVLTDDAWNDVEIRAFVRPWNAKPDAGHLAKGIPKSHFWATDPDGFNQIGCVYTAQGFEFDYVGLILGKDLVYDFERQEWKGDKKHSEDTVVRGSKDKFAELIKNSYRILLTRGLKGCYVYFRDKDTERFVKSRMEN